MNKKGGQTHILAYYYITLHPLHIYIHALYTFLKYNELQRHFKIPTDKC